ncbi:class I SAM-dependent methyltransferase [candidate division WOR-3 bacterium]|nr:class I SAM-dependent methyltransferase [candidate division WOR-3 bacterium]
MLKKIFSRFKKGPSGFMKRALYTLLIEPVKYLRWNDYDAQKYWHDRFSKYGLSLKGSGDRRLSEEENTKMYAEAAKVFTELCQKVTIDFRSASVLEIGCGTGFYTQLLHNLGVKNYIGVDITDVIFTGLKKRFSGFRFIKKDITSDKIKGKFDLIVMIDVIEHIVKENKLSSSMENVKNSLSENGIFILGPIQNTSKRHHFYIRYWSLEDIAPKFPGYVFGELMLFPGGDILIIKKH